jgi:cytochrome c-type biogenesis protein CcmH
MRIIVVNVALLLVALMLLAAPVVAKEATSMAKDPVMEKMVNEISSELRCLVCQNQTIADSSAGLAVDLKNQVREMVAKGQSQDEIVAFMVQRYGDFVLYRPPLKATTIVLWVGPFVLMVAGIVILMINVRKRKTLVVDTPLSDEENTRLKNLLSKDS